MIYFDQAASSHPKPSEVGEAMIQALNDIGSNPGRGSHRLARKAADIVTDTRERASRLFGCSDPQKAMFFSNATEALNQAIKGLSWSQGDHVIATVFEHNSIRRPLEYVKRKYGVSVTYIDWDGDTAAFERNIREAVNSNTRLIAMTHASNLTGDVFPVEQAVAIAGEHDIPVLLDASQTAGHLPINMRDMGVDMLVFPGHKGLFGPQGTGMLLVEGTVELEPILHGGTGSFSEEPENPQKWPEKFESGTLNTPGIAGLNAALAVYEAEENKNVPRETMLCQSLLDSLRDIDGVTCYGPDECQLPIVAFNILNIPSQEIAMILDSHYDIAVRAGLHCAPLAHQFLETTNQGIVRASLSKYNTKEEVKHFLQSIQEIVSAYKMM
ncbi:aminotransferase class V-fold PLP-dependent enzyme [Lentibacillus cibarius]|uniref:cysteine desulfurase n=1 Tax=Lentibacillus cibarius TaxID=2583219 RepID=A0A5S3QKL4_9BACI|nr:aminotransferase class V-fold PLP-dependent enzyme [Lentibacillus cibarius]TMN22267.1 aminotransferase class V-fold PLP-dependent enzyme [Lentibacillus cibarius]